jgi:hypothetical protein
VTLAQMVVQIFVAMKVLVLVILVQLVQASSMMELEMVLSL